MEKLKSLYKFLSPKYQTIFLEYKVDPKPRYGYGRPPHSVLYEIVNKNRDLYKETLNFFLSFSEKFVEIKDSKIEKNFDNPTWNNGFLPGLDIIGIYGMLAKYNPSKYIEIGSGNSTKVARKSISENSLRTEIISIDPFPRANIDHLSDKIIRKPIEQFSDYKFIIESLNENDILFIDNSHGVYPNSDAMICFMEILPFLKKGVNVHFHDIYIPYDYPQFMCDRFYNEQYMLSALLLNDPSKYNVILPNYFISEDKELASVLKQVWEHPNLKNVEKHGGSFWLQIMK